MTRPIAPCIVAFAIVLAGCSIESPVSRTLGARCDSSDECDDRCLRVPAASFPGGFCSVSCEASTDCQSDASCLDLEGGVCLFDCAADNECTFLGAGWRCVEVPLREDMSQMVKACLGV